MSSITKYPVFDTLELHIDPEYSFTRYQKLFPVKAGELVAGLNTASNPGNGHRYLNFDSHSFTYTHKPLLIYFYEQDWEPVAGHHLRQLASLEIELQRLHLNILVVTGQSLKALQQSCWNEGLLLEIYQDNKLELARALKIYSEQSPAWNSYAGIERNVPLPALYMLDHHRQVVVDYPNIEISEKLPVDLIKGVLADRDQYWQDRRSA